MPVLSLFCENNTSVSVLVEFLSNILLSFTLPTGDLGTIHENVHEVPFLKGITSSGRRLSFNWMMLKLLILHPIPALEDVYRGNIFIPIHPPRCCVCFIGNDIAL